MKKVQFAQVANTHNEYTSDALKDASGTYLNIHEVLDYLEERLKELAVLAGNTESQIHQFEIMARANEINDLLQELK